LFVLDDQIEVMVGGDRIDGRSAGREAGAECRRSREQIVSWEITNLCSNIWSVPIASSRRASDEYCAPARYREAVDSSWNCIKMR
jgi:hypothetical protein